MVTKTATVKRYFCDFCDKSQDDVEQIIAGPKDIHICNECVELCVEIIQEKRDEKTVKAEAEASADSVPVSN